MQNIYVLESDPRGGSTSYDIYSRLLKDRIILIGESIMGGLNWEDAITYVEETINTLHRMMREG